MLKKFHFKKLQWKLVLMLVVLVTAVMLVVGVFLLTNISNFYRDDFRNGIEQTLSEGLSADINKVITENSGDSCAEELDALLSSYSGRLGISGTRTALILNAKDGSIAAPVSELGGAVEKTPNILTAMDGNVGNSIKISDSFMDYARPFGTGDDGFILYIRDAKTSANSLTRIMMSIILRAMLIGILVSLFLGFFLAKTITSPISKLTGRARQFAEGDFDTSFAIESRTKDEIGSLIETFNYMGTVMNSALGALESEKHKVEIILEHISSGVMAFNTEQELIHINSAAKQLFKFEDGALSDLKFDDFFETLGANVYMAEFLYLEKSKNVTRDIPIRKMNVKASFAPFKTDSGKTDGIVVVFEDVTEQVALDTSRRNFVAEVSHELKTPLTVIKTYAETLQGIEDRDSMLPFIKTIETETDKMTNLVRNLLELSRFDSNEFRLSKQPFSLDEMLLYLIQTYKIEAEKKRITLSYIPSKIPSTIYADKDAIERALRNILSNAIKYTFDGGKVSILTTRVLNEVYIKIEDNGKGIPQADLAHVFERFYRVDKSRARNEGGTGLGLSIAKEIVNRHGGDITIESKLGRYTRVTVKIPLIDNDDK